MAIEVADLFVPLRAETALFDASMLRADAELKRVHGSAGGASMGVTALGLGLTALAAGGLVASIKAASDFSTQMTKLQNNTTLTDSSISSIRTSILQMATQTNAPISQLVEGVQHITNFGFSAKDAMLILNQAMMSASSTGGDTAATANMLANALHEFGMKATDAGKAMDTLHLAAALGNSTLEQFVNSSGKALAMAANMSVPLTDVSAALSALTRHGQDSAEASTLVAGALSKIINPSASVQKELVALSGGTATVSSASVGLSQKLADTAAKMQVAQLRVTDLEHKHGVLASTMAAAKLRVTELNTTYATLVAQAGKLSGGNVHLAASHVNLAYDFSAAGLKAKGLAGVMADLKLATGGNAQEILKLIPATRGGLAAMILTGTGAKDYKQILLSLNDAMAGKVHPTFSAFQRTQQTLGFQLGQLQNILQVVGITIGTILLPPLLSLVKAVSGAVSSLLDWVKNNSAIQKVIKDLGPLFTTLAGFVKTAWDDVKGWVGAFANFLTQHPKLVAALLDMGKAFLALIVAKGALTLITSAIKGLVAYFIGKNALAVLIAVLYTAWDQNWGGMRDFLVNDVWPKIHPILDALAKFAISPIGMDVILGVLSLAAAMGTLALAMRAVAAGEAALAGLKGLIGGIGDIFGGGGGKPAKTGPDQAMKDLTDAITKYMPKLTTAINDWVALLEDTIVKWFPPLINAIVGTKRETGMIMAMEDLAKAVDALVAKLPLTITLPKFPALTWPKMPALVLDDTKLITALQNLTAKFPLSALALQDAALITALDNLTKAIPALGHGPTGGTGGTGGGAHGGTFSIAGAQALTTALTTLNTTLTSLISPKLSTLHTDLVNLIAALGKHVGTGGTIVKAGATTVTIAGLAAVTTAITTLNGTLKTMIAPKLDTLSANLATLNTTILALIAALGKPRTGGTGKGSGGGSGGGVGLDFGFPLLPIGLTIRATDLANIVRKVAGWMGPAGDLGKAVAKGAGDLAHTIADGFGTWTIGNANAIRDFKNWVSSNGPSFKDAAASLGNFIWGGVTDMANATVAGAHKFSSAISYLATAGWGLIKDAVATLGAKVAAGLFDVRLFGAAMMNTLKSLSGEFLSFFEGILKSLISKIPGAGLLGINTSSAGQNRTSALGQAPNGGQNLGLSASTFANMPVINNYIVVDGKTMSTSVFNAAALDRRMRPELVS